MNINNISEKVKNINLRRKITILCAVLIASLLIFGLFTAYNPYWNSNAFIKDITNASAGSETDVFNKYIDIKGLNNRSKDFLLCSIINMLYKEGFTMGNLEFENNEIHLVMVHRKNVLLGIKMIFVIFKISAVDGTIIEIKASKGGRFI